MNTLMTCSEELKKGRRALDEIKEVSIITDWQWDNNHEKWYLEISIQVDDEENSDIPSLSFWYVLVDDKYPKGLIKVYPSVEFNTEHTFYHQSNNGSLSDNKLWRSGALCLDSSFNTFNRVLEHEEPCTEDQRLYWHVYRAVDWIVCAKSDSLVKSSDPFELPDFNEKISSLVAFNEDMVSYLQWEDIESKYGYVDLVTNKSNPLIRATAIFRDSYNDIIFPVKWGYYFSETENESIELSKGIWILLRGIPVVKFWQAPNTFEELLDACKLYDFDLMHVLETLAHGIRDGKRHFLIIGFPIPVYFGGENETIHWKALLLPTLSAGKSVQKGFREKEDGYWFRDRLSVLKKNMILDWVVSQNWNENEINNRGRVDRPLRAMKTLIIGAGAIGSAIAEILTRTGMYNIHIQDHDLLEIGNLTRHSLNLECVGKPKAKELVWHLHHLNPNSIAKSIDKRFDSESQEIKSLSKYDLIIDCTGEDKVLYEISAIEFEKTKIFASVSVGIEAKRMYIFAQKSNSLSAKTFLSKISPYLDEERKVFMDYEFPRDGVGCWNPLFPARQDDILIAASTFIKTLEKFVGQDRLKEITKIFEQCYQNDGYYDGFREVDNMYV